MGALDNYVEVAQRIAHFYQKYPNGRISRLDEPKPMVFPVGDDKQRIFIMYTAVAYRTPDDPVPAIGTAWEPWPGPTRFTRDSELMNAETSAWGRAIVAAGISAHTGSGEWKIASREEVEARMGATDKPGQAKPSLQDAITSGELEKKVPGSKTLPMDTVKSALERLDIGGRAWVIKTALGKTVKRDEKAILDAVTYIDDDDARRVIALAKTLVKKKQAENAGKADKEPASTSSTTEKKPGKQKTVA